MWIETNIFLSQIINGYIKSELSNDMATIHDGSLGWPTVMDHYMEGIVAFAGLVGHAMAGDPFGLGFCVHINGNRRK